MPVEAAQLIARVGSDTSDAQADFRRFGAVVNETAANAQQSAQRITALTESIGFQERELAQLQERLAQATQAQSTQSAAQQRAAQAIGDLTSRISVQRDQLTQLNERYTLAVQGEGIFSQSAQKLEGQINRLTESFQRNTTNLDRRQQALAQLAEREQGQATQAAQRLQLQVDRLSASITNNQNVLQTEQQRLAALADEASRAGTIGDTFGQIWTGALRGIGELGLDTVVQGVQALTGAVQDAIATGVESYGINERISQSYQSLVAVELRRTDSTLSQADALSKASERSQELVAWNQQLAINSPFSEESAAKATRMALAYGFNSDQAQRLVQVLTDTTAAMGGTEDVMQRAALALGQIEARGKTSAQEFNQLSEAGINARQILADAFGVTTAEIEKMNEAGQLTADKVLPAIIGRLETDFGGAAERQAQTIQGLQNSIEDLYAISARNLLGATIEQVQPLAAKLVDTLQAPNVRAGIEDIGDAIGDLAATVIPAAIEGGEYLFSLLQGGRERVAPLIDAFGDLYQTSQPLWAFVGDTAIPNALRLAEVLESSTIRGVVELTKAFVEQTSSAITLASRVNELTDGWSNYLLLQASILGPINQVGQGLEQIEQIQQRQRAAIEATTQAHLSQYPAFEASAQALEVYGASSEATQQKLKNYADALERQRDVMAKLEQQGASDAVLKQQADALQDITDKLTTQQQQLGSGSAYDSYAQAAQAAMGTTTEATRLSAEETEKLQQKLDAVAERGSEAYEKLQESAQTYRDAEQSRQSDHQQRLINAQSDYQGAITGADAKLHDGRLQALQTYESKVAELEDASGRKLAAMADEEARRRVDAEEKLADQLADLDRKRTEQTQQFQRDREIAEREHGEKLGQMQQEEADRAAESARTLNERLAALDGQRRDAERDANGARAAEDEAYAQRIEAFQQKINDSYEKYSRARAELQDDADNERADRTQDLQDKLIDLEQSYQSKVIDIQENLQAKLSDLRDKQADRKEDRSIDFKDDRADREQDHLDKIAELQEKANKTNNSQEKQRIQEQIAAENERYAQQEARAERDFQRQQERDARDARRAEEQAQREAARAEQQAQQELERAERQAQLQAERAERDAAISLERKQRELDAKRAIEVGNYDQDLRDLQDAHTRELAAIDAKLIAENEKLNQASQRARDEYTTRENDAVVHYQRELDTLNLNYGQQLEALQYKYDQEGIKAGDARIAAQTAFNDREKDAKDHYIRAVQQQKDALEDQERKARDSYNQQFRDLQDAYTKTNKEANDKLIQRIKDEQDRFNDQEKQALAAYDKQQKALRENLGKQLYDYADIEGKMTQVAEQAVLRRQALIALDYGYDPTQRVNEFTQRYNEFLNTNGGGGLSIGNVTINGVSDPAEIWRQVRDEAAREAQRNGYSTIGGPQ